MELYITEKENKKILKIISKREGYTYTTENIKYGIKKVNIKNTKVIEEYRRERRKEKEKEEKEEEENKVYEKERRLKGLGYRVKREKENKRLFNLGYTDEKVYKRKEGREVEIDKDNKGRKRKGKGKEGKVKVGNAIVERKKRSKGIMIKNSKR